MNFTRLALVLLFTVSLGELIAQEVEPSANPPATPSGNSSARSQLRDPVDGQFDLSAFIAKSYGFVPLVIPITEPAVGYGAGGGLIFIDKPKTNHPGKFARPNITAVGGMATENGTWGVGAVDSRNWREGRLQTVIGAGLASINLDYYGLGNDRQLRAQPLRYTLSPLGGMVRGKIRFGESQVWGGLGYSLANTDVEFNAPTASPGLPSFQRSSRSATLTPSLSYDTRDNIFTPTRGWYAEASVGLFSEVLGGDQNFQKASVVVIKYLPLAEKWTLGVRADGNFSFGEMPFYLRPAVKLRGVAAMSYQGDDVAQVEAEVRWQFRGRYSVVGFSGVGSTWSNVGPFSRQKSVVTYGTGFRYEIARQFGLHMGIDVAFGPVDPAIYIQFGSAWMRP